MALTKAMATVGTLGRVLTYDATDPRWSTDPTPLYEQIRVENPIHLTQHNFWALSRHEDCLRILRDRRSSSDALKQNPDYAPRGMRDQRDRDAGVAAVVGDPSEDARPFLFRDPPDHTRLRGLVAKAFTPRMVSELTPFIEQRVEAMIDASLSAGVVDLQESLCYPLPVAVICEMLGVPESDHERFSIWSEALARGLDPDFLLPVEAVKTRDVAIGEFALYFFELMAARRRSPGDDLLSALAAVEDSGETLTEAEMLSTCILLLVAGHETTVNLLTGSVIALSRDRDAQQRLRADPSLFRTAIDELMRVVSPVQVTGRTLLDDVTIDDVTMPAGSFAMLLVAGANRDPSVFADPNRLILDREPNPHLGFGFGLHHCLGAPLARLEARITLAALLKRTTDFEVLGDVVYRPNIVLRGVTELPVSLTSA